MVKKAESNLTNVRVADVMREIADRLERSGDSSFRVAAYRRAAATYRKCARPLWAILAEDGERGLRELPGIGESLARTTARLLKRGRSTTLERLQRAESSGGILRTLPGFGPRLAKRVEESLGARSLEAVFAAANDGRLRRVPGVGQKRLRAVRESLATRLHAGPHVFSSTAASEPPVADLLSIDQEYRTKTAAGQLPLATPKRFNPTAGAWLPVLNTERNGRRYTAHFANTARSHELGRFRDWVVIVCYSKQNFGQWTVITATRGSLAGRRLVMHHERACREHYENAKVQLTLPALD